MPTKAYFVSDLHLNSKNERKSQVFLRFLKSIYTDQELTHLFLVGDIFDFWVSDHGYFIEKFHPIVEMIDRLVQKGVQVIYFEGNHDLHLEKYWHRKLGVQVISKPQYFYLDSMVIRVEHGDLIDPEDHGYRFLKFVLNMKSTKLFADFAPEKLVSFIGEKSSQLSRHYTTYTKTVSNEAMLEKMHFYAQEAYRYKRYDLMVLGHVHIKDDFRFEVEGRNSRAVNLGSWYQQPTAFLVTPQKQEFITLV